ncbi:amino acid adenylation domain-containing protein [Salinarimonas sp.]|uniref:amino acid adenylation domain-containing protein n=1 Tax=Salinarimonas sp. TaxID=2766526 RepID=UPI0032D996CB
MTAPQSAFALLRQARDRLDVTVGDPLRPVDRDEPLLLSPGQEALWHLHEVSGSGAAYTVHSLHRLTGPLDADRLSRAVSALARRHEILRTRFPLSASGPIQHIEESGPPLVIDAVAESGLLERVGAEIAKPFDIQEAVPARWFLFELAPERHALLVVMHHILIDFWSYKILLEHLSAEYAADGTAASPAAAAIQYADYAAWQRRQEKLHGDRLATWVERLAGTSSDAALPYERPRPPRQSFRGANVRLELSGTTTTALRGLASMEGATLFHVLLAGLQATLRRLGGAEDLVVGTPVAGRSHPASRDLIGYFLNTLALRADLGGDPSFGQLVRRARTITLDALARDDVPFGRVVEALGIARDASRQPLFQVMLNLQSVPRGALSLPGIAAEEVWHPTAGAKYDLTIDVLERGDALHLTLEYAADLFEPRGMEGFGKALCAVLEAVAADPALPLSRLPLVVGPDRARLIASELGRPTAAPTSVVDSVLERARLEPRRVALRQGSFALTFAELADRSGRLAGLLARRGVARGDVVAIRMERSIAQLVTMLAAWRCGAAWTAIDPDSPSDRVAGMLRDSGARLVVEDRPSPDGRDGVPALCWSDDDLADCEPPASARHEICDLAYVTFTSGTTGRPKGVAIPHSALANYLANAAARFDARGGGAHVSSPAFDLALTNMFAPLVAGGCCEILADGVAELASRLLDGRRYGFLSLTTSHLRMLTALIGERPASGGARILVLGAEAVHPEDVRAWVRCCGPTRVVNEYGPTETTVGCSFFAIDMRTPEDDVRCGPSGTVPIGGPMDAITMHVVDADGETVPAGGTGRLTIGGAGLAWGYLGRPGLTAEAFRPDPRGGGGRLYDTGDVVRRLSDGALEFCGRADRQLKVNGVRIEPAEIEACLLSHPAVTATHVAARPAQDGRRTLVAWVAAEGVGEEMLRSHLAQRLPRAMIPSAVVIRDRLPLTRGGKLDIGALEREAPVSADADPDGGARDAMPVPADPSIVAAVAQAWAKALGRGAVAPDADVFRLGADSISAVRAFAVLREAYPDLRLRQVFDRRTPRGLAADLASSRAGDVGGQVTPLDGPVSHATHRPASSAQKRLWLQARMFPDDTSHHVSACLLIRGALDRGTLADALSRLRARHEILDAVVAPVGDDDIAFEIGNRPLPLRMEDAPFADEAARTAWLRERIAEPFTLTRGPLWRVTARRIAPDQHLVLLTMHHIVTDGWSVAILLEELLEECAAALDGREVALPAPGRSFFDCAADDASSESDAASARYWKRTLEGVPTILDMPTDAPRPEVRSFAGESVAMRLADDVVDGLRRVADARGTTLNVVVLAAFSLLLARLSGQSDFCIGLPCAGREDARDLRSVGLYVAMAPIRVRPRPEARFEEFVGDVRDTVLGAVENQRYALERIIADLAPPRDPRMHPLYQVVFNGLGARATSARSGELHAELVPVPETTSKVDLTLYVVEPDGRVDLQIVYNAQLFVRERMTAFGDQLRGLLEAAAADPSRALQAYALPATTPARLDRRDARPPVGFLARLEAALTAHAARTALVSPDATWSYAEVDARAQALAQALTEQDATRAPVAVICGREPSATVAMLACLRAARPFCLLDAELPRPYLESRIRSARPSVVLAKQAHAAADVGGLPVWPLERVTRRAAEGSGPVRPSPAPAEAESERVAYLAFTSGSTGEPKLVASPLSALDAFSIGYLDELGIAARDRCAALSAVGHDPFLRDALIPLAAGAMICFPDAGSTLGERLGEWLASSSVTVANTSVSRLRTLAPNHMRRATALRMLLLGGERLEVAAVGPLLAERPDLRVLNVYGTTETPQIVAYGELRATTARDCPLTDVAPGSAIALLTPDGRPAGVGEVAEICALGASLALGYANDVRGTAERFLPAPGGRAYRTGDLGRIGPDGALTVLGRLDDELNIRGHRIHPAEVTACLLRLPGIRDAFVTAQSGHGGEPVLTAWIMPSSAGVDETQLARHARETMPSHLRPGRFLVCDDLPRLPGGKVDRRALLAARAPVRERPASGAIEARVAGAMARTLGVDGLGAQDDFFQLGGHSLLAPRLCAELERAFGVEIGLLDLFRDPSVGGLAATIARRQAEGSSGGHAASVTTHDPERRHEPFPLTDLQAAYWIGRSGDFEISGAGARTYVEIEMSDLDVDRFRKAWSRVVERHDMLRAIVLETGRQQVLRDPPVHEIPVHDLADLTDAEAIARVEALRTRIETRVHDPARWPLFDVAISKLPGPSFRLHIGISLLICDAWSIGVLERDLATFYADPDAPLPPLPIGFRDFAVAEAARVGQPAYLKARAYWTARMDALPAGPELPILAEPGAVARTRFERSRVSVDARAWEALKRACRTRGLTPTGLVLAAFVEILGLHAADDRFLLTLTLFNREPRHPRIADIVGDFTSVSVFEAPCGAGSFEELARTVQERLWTDLDNRAFNGIEVLRELTRRRGGARAAAPVVFTSLLGLEEARGRRLPGAVVYRSGQTPQVSLDCIVHEQDGGLAIEWNTVADLFPCGLIAGMQELFRSRLEALADLADWDVALVEGLASGQAERRSAANATVVARESRRLEAGFLAWSARDPERLAVVDPRGGVSYGALRAQAAAVAAALAGEPGEVVGVVMDRGREQPAALLGALWAGRAYLPATPDLPTARLGSLIADGGVRTVLTQSWLAEAMSWPEGVRVVAVDRLAPVDGDPPGLLAAGEARAGAEALAYVIYTSGSTGRPKGVAVSHAAAWNTIADVNARFGVTQRDRVLSVSALSFDLSVWDVFGLLSCGGAVVLPAPSERPDPADWLARMQAHGVSVWNSAPALLEITLAEAGAHAPGLAGLRLALVSGDWVAVDLAQRLRRHAPDVRMVALGGATEAAIWSNYKDMGALRGDERSVPYGRPLANQAFHVLDPHGRPRPDWVPGELHIGGAGLARGYWRDPARTAERFVPHPRTGERLYRTGDMGRYLPDGEIEFLGRRDTQVKIQGHRIELAEIEAALARHPRVGRSVAAAPGPRGQRRLAAWVTPDGSNAPPDEAELRRHLAETLPAHMIPARIAVLDRLPLTANGKVDRNALPDLSEPAPARSGGAEGARPSPAAARIAAAWAEVLGLPEIGRDDDFFRLGGDSVLAARIVVRLREDHGLAISIRTLFENPTPAALARTLEHEPETKTKPAARAARRIPRSPRAGVFQASLAQESIFVAEQVAGDPSLYLLPMAIRIHGALDVEALQDAVRRLVHRHEPLRTSFAWRDDRLVQTVAATAQPAFVVDEIDPRSSDDEEDRVWRVIEAESAATFDPGALPLVRFRLIRTAPERAVLVATFHHLIADALSFQVLLRDLDAFYRMITTGDAEPPPAPDVQLADFADWQRSAERAERLPREIAYWTTSLSGLPPRLELPVDRPERIGAGHAAHWIDCPVDAATAAAVRRFAAEHGHSLFAVLLAAWSATLARIGGVDDLAVAVPVSGRDDPELQDVVGCFVNTVLVRAPLEDDPSLATLAARIAARALDAAEHGGVPLERILEALGAERAGGRAPLAQTSFVMQPASHGVDRIGPCAVELVPTREGRARYDLTLSVTPARDDWTARLKYDEHLFTPAAARTIAGLFAELLAQAAVRPDVPLGRITLAPAPATDQSRPPPRACADGRTVPERIVAIAEHLPDAVAVRSTDGSLSRAQLVRLAERVAGRLQRLGCEVENLVAVLMPSRIELAPVLLGVWRAGGAYLPLDPDLPKARLAEILETAGASLLIVADDAAAAQWASDGLPVTTLDALLGEAPDPEPAPSPTPIDPAGLAYVIYTSGSTGRPKGVEVEHRQLAAYLEALWLRHPELQTDGFAVAQSAAVDFGLTVFWGGLANGVCVHLMRDVASDAVAFGHYMAAHRIGGLKISPSHLDALLQAAPEPADLMPASVLMLGGESTSWDAVDRYLELRPDLTLLNHYGPTETTVGAITADLRRVARGRRVPLGRPLPHARVFVADKHLRPAPVGAVGELCIGGAGVARGYRGQPAATAGAFLPDAAGEAAGRRIYRTGDLARVRPDGEIEFLGRADAQIKIRGYRVEPAEVEARLRRLAGIGQATTRLFRSGGQELFVAYVVPDGEGYEESGSLAALRDQLPSYMVPSALVSLDALPLLPNGKVDRLRLPPPASADRPADRGPRTETERLLAALFEEALGTVPGRDDDFFRLGGHSLSAMQLLAAVRRSTGVAVRMSDFFGNPSVEGLARLVAEARIEGVASARAERVDPDPEGRFEPFPLTEIQQAYWIGRTGEFELGNTSAHAYWEYDATQLDLARLERALRRVIERHDMLRAIVLPSGELRVLEAPPPFEIGVVDARGTAPEEAEAVIDGVRASLESEVFDLSRWPLFDVRAVLLDGGRVRLHFSVDIIIGDAWSFIVLSRELADFYADPDREASPLPLTFRDYVLAMERAKDGLDAARARDYWRERLDSLPGPALLPMLRDPASITKPRFERTRLRLEAPTWSRLKARAARERVTPSALVLAVYAEVLASYAESGRFVLNLTLFNRVPVHPDINRVVGDFTSVVLVEVDAAPTRTFGALVRSVQERLWRDLDNRQCSGVEVMRMMTARRGGARYAAPLVFTSMFGSETLARDLSPASLPITLVKREGQTPQAWIDHMVVEEDGALLSVWNTVADLFPCGLIAGMQELFRSRLEALADLADWDVALVEGLASGQAERRSAANATVVARESRRLEAGFLAWSARDPERLAVVDPRGGVSYGALRAQAAAVAAALAGEPGEVVGVVMDRGREQPAALLGALWAGRAYLPATPDLPTARLGSLIADGGVRTVLTQSWLAEAMSWPEGVRVVAVDRLAPVDGDPPGLLAAGEARAGAEALAYVIYTSGSTGRPKGVAVSHAAAWNTIADVNARFGVTQRDRVLSVSALSFDLSVWDVFGLLSCGGAVVLPAPSERPDPADWLARMQAHGVSVWNSAPALLEITLAEAGAHAPGLAGLRLALVSGDWVAVDLAQRLRRHAPDVRMVALGGATEAAIWSNYKDMGALRGDERSVPYGRPLANQAFHVLDPHGRPRPDWVPGELHIGGAGLARGYWRDPARTAERFVPHPRTGERLYRTGDMGRYLPDGEIEFLGRRDTQVKIQGHRIELAEIEAALARHPRVGRSVAAAPGPRGQRRLAAWVTPDGSNAPPDEAELRRHLAETLPAHMIPARIAVLDRLPLTANGKVDRNALPDLSEPAPARSGGAEGARPSPAAARIAAAWAEVLGLPEIGRDDDFFRLGGDSVLAARIVVRLREDHGLAISIRTLFENPTPAALARTLEHEPETKTKPAARAGDWDAIVSELARPQRARAGDAAGATVTPGTGRPEIDIGVAEARLAFEAAAILGRRNHRVFAPDDVPVAHLAGLLSAVRSVPAAGRPKLAYASAGGLYPVGVLLTVHGDGERSRVPDLRPGTYRFDPGTTRLSLLTEGFALPVESYGDLNRTVAAAAAFTILLVADLDAIAPTYGRDSFRFALIETGAMTQVLEMQAARLELGLCHIGTLALDEHRDAFALTDRHMLMHTLVGAAAFRDAAATNRGARAWTEEEI